MIGLDKAFAGSIPTLYERYLVTLILQPHATDFAGRLGSMNLPRLLEVADGIGVIAALAPVCAAAEII